MTALTRWQLYRSSAAGWEAMLAAVAGARERIELEQFILYPDEVGRQFLELCAQKAQAGVSVRLLCDAAGSWRLFRSPWPEFLRQAGVKLAPFNSLVPYTRHWQRLWFFRDHQKLLVVDGEVGFTGGMCLGWEMREWRDAQARVEGPVVAEMSAVFAAMWARAHHRRPPRPPQAAGGAPFRYVVNYPIPGQRPFHRELIEVVRAARRSISIVTPYLAPDYRLKRALTAAARRGVRVALLLPLVSDHPLADRISQTYFENLLAAGVEIYRYEPAMLHAKFMVVDGAWATVGSFNLDHMSAFYNFEANLVSTDPEFSAELGREFAADCREATPVQLGRWRQRGAGARAAEFLLRSFRVLF